MKKIMMLSVIFITVSTSFMYGMEMEGVGFDFPSTPEELYAEKIADHIKIISQALAGLWQSGTTMLVTKMPRGVLFNFAKGLKVGGLESGIPCFVTGVVAEFNEKNDLLHFIVKYEWDKGKKRGIVEYKKENIDELIREANEGVGVAGDLFKLIATLRSKMLERFRLVK